MAITVYSLGVITTLLCSVLLLRQYLRSHIRLLLWSGLCFAGLAVSNGIVFVDLIIYPERDLHIWRLSIAALSMALLAYGLIWEGE